MMITKEEVPRLMDEKAEIVDRDGQKIGKIEQIYLDDRTNEPEWATAATGLFGSSESFIPLRGAETTDGGVRVQYTKDVIKDAPRVDAGGHLDAEQENHLYRHYGLSAPTAGQTAGTGGPGGPGGPGEDVSGPNTDEAMTRSEEQLHVGTEQQETGRARLRKYVVTEDVQTTVPVSHEEVRVEREPITEANRDDAASGPAFSEEEHEVTLHAEKPVVSKEEKPVERVRMDKETVTDEAEIDEQVRKERIEAEGDTDDTRR